jgi:hypothetical protein
MRFSVYLLLTTLHAAGFPRKSGFLGRKLIVDTLVFNAAIREMVLIGVGLGVGRPELVVRIFANSFDADAIANWAEFFNDLSPNRQSSIEDISEWARLPSDAPPSFEWNWLFGVTPVATINNKTFLLATLWGLLNPKEGEEALEQNRINYTENAPLAIDAGLEIAAEPSFTTNDSF